MFGIVAGLFDDDIWSLYLGPTAVKMLHRSQTRPSLTRFFVRFSHAYGCEGLP